MSSKTGSKTFKFFYFVGIVCHLQGFIVGCQGEGLSLYKQLADDLLDKYGSRDIRPVFNHNKTLDVFFQPIPVWFADFDEARQVLTFVSANRYQWTDEFLKWNPDDYGGADVITFGKEQIWFPDVTATERVTSGSHEVNMEKPFIIVTNEGEVVYYSLSKLAVYCKMDIRLFPYDEHDCTIRFSTWAFEGDQVTLLYGNQSDSSDVFLKKNGVWSVSSYKIEEVEIKYLCCPEPYREVHYTINIQRESKFYVLNIGIPSFLLSWTTLAVFLLHPESGEKVSLCVNNLLALILFQQLLASSMPPTGDHSPIIAYYFVVMISISFLSVLTTCLTLGMYHNKGSKPLPRHLKRILLMLRHEKASDTSRHSSSRGIIDEEILPDNDVEMDVPKTQQSSSNANACEVEAVDGGVDDTGDVSGVTPACYEDEWKRASIRIDVIFFLLSLSTMIICLLWCAYLFHVELNSRGND